MLITGFQALTDFNCVSAAVSPLSIANWFHRVFNELGDRIQDNQVQGIQSLEISVGQVMDYRKLMTAFPMLIKLLQMRTFEVALKIIPRIGDEKKRLTEEKALLDLWLAMDEIKAKVSYLQPELSLNYGQMSLNLEIDD